MVFWAEELIKLAEEVSNKMESIDAPKDENGQYIYGTPEIIQFNKYAFALARATRHLKEALDEMEEN